ncbi:hypothetical protein PIJ50_13475, partial [Falsirhodobacter sp. 20TX0035]
MSGRKSHGDCNLLDAQTPSAQQNFGCLYTFLDQPAAGCDAGRVAEAAEKGAKAHPAFSRHALDGPILVQPFAQPVEERRDLAPALDWHRPLQELCLPACQSARKTDPLSAPNIDPPDAVCAGP